MIIILRIIARDNFNVSIPNIQNDVLVNCNIINPTEIKLFKIFIINNDVILNADNSINGIEIIIYNNSDIITNIKTNNLINNDMTIDDIITTLESHKSKRFIYISYICKWIVST